MNPFFAFLLAGALRTTTPVTPPVAPVNTTYAVTERMAVWVSADAKLHLMLARSANDTHVRLTGHNGEYVRQAIGLGKQAVAQRYDLSALPAGTYQLTIQIGRQTVKRAIAINQPAPQRLVTLE